MKCWKLNETQHLPKTFSNVSWELYWSPNDDPARKVNVVNLTLQKEEVRLQKNVVTLWKFCAGDFPIESARHSAILAPTSNQPILNCCDNVILNQTCKQGWSQNPIVNSFLEPSGLLPLIGSHNTEFWELYFRIKEGLTQYSTPRQ